MPRLARATLWTLYAVGGWFILVSIPTFLPEPSLDVSWATVLHHAWAARWQFGRDIVFNYGPLGYLHVGMYTTETWPWFLGYQVVQRAFYIGLVCRLSFRLAGAAKLMFLSGSVLFPTTDSDSFDLLFITLGAALLCSTSRVDRLLAIPVVFFFSVVGLIKGSYLCLVFFVIGCVVFHSLTNRRWLAAATLPVAFVSMLLAVWVGPAGQALGGLPIFLRDILEISNAYEQGMTWPPGLGPLAAGVAVIILLSFGIARAGWQEGRARGWPLMLMLLGALLLAWKQGFVRADVWHTAIFFAYAISLSAALPVFFAKLSQPREAGMYWVVVTAVAVCAFCGGIGESRLTSFADSAPAKVFWLISPFKAAAALTEKLQANRQRFALPKVRTAVGRSSIDVFGLEQAIALLNDLNYRPPPVFQAFAACTRKLVDLNVAFYASRQAPEFVLFKLQTIDNRFPTLDNSRVLLELLRRYQFVVEEGGYLLLHQKDLPVGGSLPMRLLAKGQIAAGESLAIPTVPGAIWCELDIRENLLGRLTRLAWGQPPLYMRLIREAGSTHEEEYRIIPNIARGGFLLSPLVSNNDRFRELLTQDSTDPVDNIKTLVIESNQVSRWLMQPRIGFAIYRLR